MSMLAERRRKTKWVINPTKKPLWTTDSGDVKFGKELMEKMGWAPGKGLGLKEQGIQEPLKVLYKNNAKGLGFKGNDEDWIEHQDEFNSLLNQLAKSDDNPVAQVEKNEIKSLEEKSKKSKTRVHYQKFTRGKDLARYSENDLACILGTNKIKKDKVPVEDTPKKVVETPDGYETSFGVTTINSGSIQDYFKKKFTFNKNKLSNIPEEETQNGFNDSQNNCIQPEENMEVVGEEKKSKKRKHNSDSEVEQSRVEESDQLELKDEFGMEIKKKKKSKDVTVEDLGLCDVPKKKKKKGSADENQTSELSDNVNSELIMNEEPDVVNNDEVCKKSKKKSKKKCKNDQEDNIPYDIVQAEIPNHEGSIRNSQLQDQEDIEVELMKHKKKKKKKSKLDKLTKENQQDSFPVETDMQDVNLVSNSDNTDELGVEKSKHKKKKKDKKEKLEKENRLDSHPDEVDTQDVDTMDLEVFDSKEELNVELTKSKKKKKKEEKLEQEDEKEKIAEEENKESEENHSKKKKSKKHKKEKDKKSEKETNEENSSEIFKETNNCEDISAVSNNKDCSKPFIPSCENKSVSGDVIHTHKPELFKVSKNYTNDRVLKLVCGAEIEEFKGSNLKNLPGYGTKKSEKNDKNR